VKAELDRYRHNHFDRSAASEVASGRALADVTFEIEAKLAGEAIRRAIEDHVRAVT
jgi:hypothetical protein